MRDFFPDQIDLLLLLGIILIKLTEVGRPAYCGWQHSLENAGFYHGLLLLIILDVM